MPALDRAKTIQAAEKFVKAGKIAEAVREYQKVADDNPRDMNVMNKLGDLLVRAGRNAEALKHFVRIADFYARDGFFLKAIAMYKKVTKLDPSNIESQQRLAAMYTQQGLTSEARGQYLQLADQLARQNHVPAAVEALRQVLEIEPENSKVRVALADLLGRAGKQDEAAREYCHLARVTLARGDMVAAVEALRRGVQASPGLAGLAGLALSMVVRCEAAPASLLAVAEEIARHAGRSALALLVLAEAFRRSGRGPDADEAFRRLAAGVETEDDLNAEALAILARHHDAHGRSTEAWQMLDRAIAVGVAGAGVDPAGLIDAFLERHPDHGEALARRVEVAAGAGDAPAEIAALRRLVPLLVAAGEPGQAEKARGRLASLSPDDADMDRMRAETAGEGRHDPASPVSEPAPADAGQDEEIDVLLVESEGPGEALRATSEARSADEMFNLDEEPAPGGEPATPAAVDGGGPATSPEATGASPAVDPEEEAYGPGSRIQEIQSADARGLPIDEDFISEHLTEAEVFVKYGLHGKAREQLQVILDRYPDHEKGRMRLKDILVSEGNLEAAIRECLAIADIMRNDGREADARVIINEAVRLDPESPLVERHRMGAPPPVAVADDAVGDTGRAASLDRDGDPADDELTIEIDDAPDAAAAGDPGGDFAATTVQTRMPAPGGRIEAETPDNLPHAGSRDGGPPPVPTPGPVTGDAVMPDIGESLADLIAGIKDSPEVPTLVDAGGPDPDDEKLGEVDFYVEQGLVDEARQVLFQLGKQFPGSAAVAQRLRRLDHPAAPPPPVRSEAGAEDIDFEVEQALAGKAPAAKPAAASRRRSGPRATRARPVFKMEKHPGNGDGDFVDLGAELSRTLDEDGAGEPAASDPLDGQDHSFDDIFAAFKKGVEQQVESDDFETHYNLGIAYKEMGLVDEAIGEFQFAARDPSKTLECCGILGLCFRDKGMPDLALKWYRRGLDMPDLDEHQSVGLRYDMAEVYREKGEYDEALRAYTDVYGVDSTYRDVSARIREMKSHLAGSGR